MNWPAGRLAEWRGHLMDAFLMAETNQSITHRPRKIPWDVAIIISLRLVFMPRTHKDGVRQKPAAAGTCKQRCEMNTMERIEINWVWLGVHQSNLKNFRRLLKNCLSSGTTSSWALWFGRLTIRFSGDLALLPSNRVPGAQQKTRRHRPFLIRLDRPLAFIVAFHCSPGLLNFCVAIRATGRIMGNPRVMSSCTLFPEKNYNFTNR